MVLWSGLRLTMATPATTGTCRESNVRIEMVMMIFFRFNVMTAEIVTTDFTSTDIFPDSEVKEKSSSESSTSGSASANGTEGPGLNSSECKFWIG